MYIFTASVKKEGQKCDHVGLRHETLVDRIRGMCLCMPLKYNQPTVVVLVVFYFLHFYPDTVETRNSYLLSSPSSPLPLLSCPVFASALRLLLLDNSTETVLNNKLLTPLYQSAGRSYVPLGRAFVKTKC